MKKILLLGGSTQQIPAIMCAKEVGYYTIVCDYLADNPGQFVADKFYLESTTDKDKILEIAMKENIDGIVAYASDPAALTAAYVANKLDLQSNKYSSVEILSQKHLFRNFLRENNFNCPKSKEFKSFENVYDIVKNFTFPVMVKPIDSSGSKGVSKVEDIMDLSRAFNYAMDNSRCKTVIIEEYIHRDHDFMIGGDVFVIDGKVVFWGLISSHRDKNGNPFVPIGNRYPLDISEYRMMEIKKQTQRLIDLLEIKFGAFNIEIMFTEKNELYFIEVGPRNGGNMIPDFLEMATGVDTIKSTVKSAIGEFDFNLKHNNSGECYSTYVIHVKQDGILKSIEYSKELTEVIIKEVMYKQTGDKVEAFEGANKALGILFMKYESKDKMNRIMDDIDKHINVKLS